MTRPVARPWSSFAKCSRILAAVGLLAPLSATGPSFADDVAAKGRDLVARQAAAIVRVTATVKQDKAAFGIQFGTGGERTANAIGTVVDPSGIVVLAMGELKPQVGDVMIMVDGERKKFEQKSEISKPVIHLADGTEVPARIALEDPETGLACVVPEKPLDKPLACVPFQDGPQPRQLDHVMLISRLGEKSGHEPSVQVTRIAAVVSKPRRSYNVGEMFSGGAWFDLDGRFIGVTTPVIWRPEAGDFSSVSYVITPAADIADLAAQVREQRGKPAAAGSER